MNDEPIRTQTAQIIRSAFKTNTGTLLLNPDRLSHVASAAMGAAFLGGVGAMAVTNKMAKIKAASKEAEGGKGVTTIPLSDLAEVRKGTQGLQRNLLEPPGGMHEEAAGGTRRNAAPRRGPRSRTRGRPGGACFSTPEGEFPATITGAGFILGTEGPDVIVGSPGRDFILARGGDDLVCGGGGNDYIDGGAGNDTLVGGEDGPPFAATGSADTLIGGPGDDTLAGLTGPDNLIGGDGDDNIIGFGGDDRIIAGPGADTVFAGPGNDVVSGDDGSDQLWGNFGSDIIAGGGGNDEIDGDNPFQGDPPPGSLPVSASTDTCTGGAGEDSIFNCERGDASQSRDPEPPPPPPF